MTLRPLLLVTIVATAAGCAAPASGAGETTASSAPDADVAGADADATSPDTNGSALDVADVSGRADSIALDRGPSADGDVASDAAGVEADSVTPDGEGVTDAGGAQPDATGTGDGGLQDSATDGQTPADSVPVDAAAVDTGAADDAPDDTSDVATGPKTCEDGQTQPAYCEPEHLLPKDLDPYSDFELPEPPPIEGFLGGFLCDEPPPKPAPGEEPGPCMILLWGGKNWGCCDEDSVGKAYGLTWFGYDCNLNESFVKKGTVLDPAPPDSEAVVTTWNAQGQKVKEVTTKNAGPYQTITWDYDATGRMVERVDWGSNPNYSHRVQFSYFDTPPFPDLIQQEYEYLKQPGTSPDDPWVGIGTTTWEYDQSGRPVWRKWKNSGQVELSALYNDRSTHWTYLDQPNGDLLVREEVDEAGACLPEWCCDYPVCFDTVDGKFDYGAERRYDAASNLLLYRPFVGTVGTLPPQWDGCSYPTEQVTWGVSSEYELIREYRYDEQGRLTEEWAWDNDCEWITEHEAAADHLWALWHYDEFGRPKMRVIPYSYGLKVTGVYSYHYDCWQD